MNEISERVVARVEDALAKLIAAREAWIVVWEAHYTARNQLEDVKADMITGGHVTGKNAEERAAQLDKLVLPQIEAQRAAAIAEQRAKLRMETAEDALRAVLAVAALHAKI